MGLDQWAHKRRGEPREVQTTNIVGEPMTVQEYPENEEIAYWRKHPNLQGFMEQLYREKGGEAESFNCVDVVLTSEDIDKLEQAVEGKQLPETSGFFFGSNGDDYYAEQDREFIANARQAIADGYEIVYSSWW